MKQRRIFILFSTLLLISFTAKAQNCDPWIQKAYLEIFKRNPTTQECNIKNYNNGSWNSYCELVSYVAAYKRAGDPWIFKAYCELYNRVPSTSESNIYNYNNGSWHSYDQLKAYISNFQKGMVKERTERIQASYLLAFGRKATQSEVNYWLGQPDKTITEYLTNHRQFANSDKGTMKALIIKSYKDVLGREPTSSEVNYWMNKNMLYVDLTKNHVQWLAGNPSEYENVIRRSYQAILNRQPDAGEINYWKSQGTLSYVVLLSCHEEWKRANGQTAKKTSGSNSISSSSSSLQTYLLSNKVANEVKIATGINNSGNVIAPGGGNVIAAGGGNVIAAGGGNVIAAGGGN